ncbi:hypothetical protein MTR67_051523 [Solanum verrucosum]|uniref:Uncharacterized protein n=1 Tax=Solanum verrucosum TaxID=315347 RepID=A0AAF0V7I7_SOLVR|nr:hypothetical protein MTR67_051523 [Solanum verrucosum]
MAPLEALW